VLFGEAMKEANPFVTCYPHQRNGS
jgi:hypothetical protein